MENFNVENYKDKPFCNIKVIGVGGGGNNAVNRMKTLNISGVDFVIANTDAQVLINSPIEKRLLLGRGVTHGLGAGSNPEVGKKAALESEEEIKEMLQGADMVFVSAGMGGGTGTGASPVIARIARELGALTIGIVTRPFTFEGKKRNANAAEGIHELKQNVDSLIIISNDNLLRINGGIPLKDSFKEADNVLAQSVQTITDLVVGVSLINLDFADVKTVMHNKGTAMIGIGIGEGEKKALDAASRAITSPLLEASIIGAKHAIVNVTGGASMTLFDANDAVEYIREAVGSDGELNVIFGVSVDENLGDKMKVSIIATDFPENIGKENDESMTIKKLEPLSEVQVRVEDKPKEEVKEPVSVPSSSVDSPKVDEKESIIPSFFRKKKLK
ncbi:TPA: cell division protein FtsZ [bacterium]|nr:cell division protein FtsZ [bacterium]